MGLKVPVRVHRSFCRVSGVVEPAIRFEVWMPLENWNGRFQGLGLGAFWGALPYEGMAQALDKGYAVGGTDTGHQSDGTMEHGRCRAALSTAESWVTGRIAVSTR